MLEQRLTNLRSHVTYLLYCNVCRSLFKKDKLLFSLLLAAGLARGQNEISDEEWKFLLTGGIGVSNIPENSFSDWLSDSSWLEFVNLSKIQEFSNILKHMRVISLINNFANQLFRNTLLNGKLFMIAPSLIDCRCRFLGKKTLMDSKNSCFSDVFVKTRLFQQFKIGSRVRWVSNTSKRLHLTLKQFMTIVHAVLL